jgi:hypothetical protein
MAVVSQELALRYLLELSTDIRVALLLSPEGDLLAAAPERPRDSALRSAVELVRSVANAAGNNAPTLEADLRLERGSVFLVRERDRTLVCVTGPFALPGLILHDMRAVLDDLERGGTEAPAP